MGAGGGQAVRHPREITHIADGLFQLLPEPTHIEFGRSWWAAVPVGADLSDVAARFLLDVLVDPRYGVLTHTQPGSAQRSAVESTAGLVRRQVSGDTPSAQEWEHTRAASRDAARQADVTDDTRTTIQQLMLARYTSSAATTAELACRVILDPGPGAAGHLGAATNLAAGTFEFEDDALAWLARTFQDRLGNAPLVHVS